MNRTEQDNDGWSAISGGKMRMKQGWELSSVPSGRECSFSVMGEKGVCGYPAVYTARWTVSGPTHGLSSL